MRSSTSNSETQIALRGVKLLLAAITVAILAMELGGRYFVPLINWNMRRFHSECSDIMKIRRDAARGDVSILLLGNSLTYTDIDLDVLNQGLGTAEKVHRWAIDDTNYLDWYYGLRRAFRAEARPRYVVIGARTSHLLGGHVRGRFFAHYIMAWHDLGDAASRTGVDLNGLSNMALAQTSAFYGSREEIYKRCVMLLLPRFPQLGRVIASGGRGGKDLKMDRSALLTERLTELRELCAKHGSQVIVWIPPTPAADPLAEMAVEAGQKVNVPVLVPGRQLAWTDLDFRDGYHLTATASKRFTSLFAKELQPVLDQLGFAENFDKGKDLSLSK